MEDAARQVLLWFILPLWLAAGVADWLCHRATDIAHTTGAKESLLHLLMLGLAAVPTLLGLFLEVNSLTFTVMLGALVLHQATALWDMRYAVPRREVRPIEQHVHSYLELVPMMALLLLVVLHWPQFLALFGQGEAPARWGLEWKRDPVPGWYVFGILGAMALLEVLPYLEELWRGLRINHGALVPAPGKPLRRG
jgi:hypothetical protein